VLRFVGGIDHGPVVVIFVDVVIIDGWEIHDGPVPLRCIGKSRWREVEKL
jgi:hypothetical protein